MKTSLKTCFKCDKEKPLSDFYRHSEMADGHLNKCKSCTKRDTKKNRRRRLEYYRAYDRMRGNRQSAEYRARYKDDAPGKAKARHAVSNAIRDGLIARHSCEICGSPRTHGHHDDYLKPLSVRWLCPGHHSQWHAINGEGANGDASAESVLQAARVQRSQLRAAA